MKKGLFTFLYIMSVTQDCNASSLPNTPDLTHTKHPSKAHDPLMERISGHWFIPTSITFQNNSVGISDDRLKHSLEDYKYLYFRFKKTPNQTVKGYLVYYFPKNGIGRFQMRAYYWNPTTHKSTYVDLLGVKRTEKNPWLTFSDIDRHPVVWNGPIRPDRTVLTLGLYLQSPIEPLPHYANCERNQICPRLPQMRFKKTSEQSLEAYALYDEYVKKGGVIVPKPTFGIFSMLINQIGHLNASMLITFKPVDNIEHIQINEQGQFSSRVFDGN